MSKPTDQKQRLALTGGVSLTTNQTEWLAMLGGVSITTNQTSSSNVEEILITSLKISSTYNKVVLIGMWLLSED